MLNTLGQIFQVHTFGESHGKGLGAVIDGCPAGVVVDEALLQDHLNKRRPGQSNISTERTERDQAEILSGVFNGKTTGAPIAVLVRNADAKPADYDALKDVYRPSHADFTYAHKYGHRDYRGGGRSSARTTLSWVIGGAFAAMYLNQVSKIKLGAYVSQVHQLKLSKNYPLSALQQMDNAVRCPDVELAKEMEQIILAAKNDGDSLGGTITCLINGLEAGLGEPQFGKLQAQLAHAMMSINATKGFEYGAGFDSANHKGSELNDEPENLIDTGIKTKTNHSGGMVGGISNGEDVHFKVAFKPTATIGKTQQTINTDGEKVILAAKGRHDPCVLPRAVAIVEAMTWLVLADAWLMNLSSKV
ncbi:chorismate synthase [Bacteroidia bacterium]|nr:chorismate synthase [Bacteroidia bacterium]